MSVTTRAVVIPLLCALVSLAFAQTQTQNSLAAQDNGIPVFHAQSKLVVVRVMVVDKKAWRNGPNDRGQRCVLATHVQLYHLPATEPFMPPECEGIFIRGLTAKDFHLFVDGVEQQIRRVTSADDAIKVRDNKGFHIEDSETPTGRWSSTGGQEPICQEVNKVCYADPEYGLFAQNRYDLSFVPQKSDSEGCHKIEVKVDRRKSIVAARDEYCNGESPSDLLSGSAFGKQLEEDLASGEPGRIPLALTVGVFKVETGGRVRVGLEIPVTSLHWHWRQDWILDAKVGVLGLIYSRDGSILTRFSDVTGLVGPHQIASELGMGRTTIDGLIKGLEETGISPTFANYINIYLENRAKGTLPIRYETYLDLPPGEYDVRFILGDGQTFGRAEAHLRIENHDENKLALSSVMLSNRFRDAHAAEVERKTANFAPQYVPMVSKGVEFTPAGDTHFKSDEPLIAYFEVYKPAATKKIASKIEAHLRIVDAKSDEPVKDFPPVDIASYEQPDSSTIPVAREVPFKELPKGSYRLQVQVTDSTGSTTPWRSADFAVEEPPASENSSPFPTAIPEP